ncbi:MAG: hypothetical protein PHU42_04275 [Patescibacteria group bacterium]|nr:hypothetical protein [Patescibacteria group bacterium]
MKIVHSVVSEHNVTRIVQDIGVIGAGNIAGTFLNRLNASKIHGGAIAAR